MNSVEFKNIRQKFNLSYSKLARLTGLKSAQIIRSWENGAAIPEHIVKFLKELNQQIELTQKAVVEDILEMPSQTYAGPFIKYANDQDFLFADPKLFNFLLCHEIHTTFLKNISNSCKESNIDITVINFNKQKYTSWLKKMGYCNCDHHRSEWVSLKTQFPISFEQQELMDKFLTESIKNIRALKKIIFQINI